MTHYAHTRSRYTRDLKVGDRVVFPTSRGETTRVADITVPDDANDPYVIAFTNSHIETRMWDAMWTVILTNAQHEEEERAAYAEELRATLAPHQTIYTSTEQASRGSSVVHVKLYTAEHPNPEKRPYIRNITHLVAQATGSTLSDLDGIAYGGYGYSKTFQAVYSLGRALFPNGYDCTGAHCRSNDHINGEPRDGKMHHRDGGYYYVQSSL